MQTLPLRPLLFAAAALLAGCASVSTSTSLLNQTRADYQIAQANPNVARYAPLEIKLAGETLARANQTAERSKDAVKIDKLAYLAKQQIALAREVTKQKTAEAQLAIAAKDSARLQLAERSSEAERAKVLAAQATLAAQVAQADTAEAKAAAAASLRETEMAQAKAAQLEAQLADLEAQKTERGLIITMGDVLFGTDMARLTPDGLRTAQKLADVLQQNPQRTVLIEGFTDSTGASAHNQELSARRANAVRGALLEMGVARERVAIRGYGEAYPVAANDSASHRQLNRRVEIVLSDVNGKTVAR